MKTWQSILFGLLMAGNLGTGVCANDGHQKGDIKNTVGPMTEPVIRARLRALGYADIKITKSRSLRYRIQATKNGQPAILDFHPQTGDTVEIGPGERPVRTWHMPLEPVETVRPATTPK